MINEAFSWTKVRPSPAERTVVKKGFLEQDIQCWIVVPYEQFLVLHHQSGNI